ncbi:MAG TPA: amidohydrolase [Acidobacteriota bacterium]|nr:amidohydrolase [Acidobacteriota bacterium]
MTKMKTTRLGFTFLTLSIVLLSAAGCSSGRPAPADTIIVNARVYTVDAAKPWAESVAIREGRIVAVGSNKEIARHKGKTTNVIDATGRLVLPGIADSHVHFVSGSSNLAVVDLAGAKTVEEVQARIRAYVQANPQAAWIQGRGWMYPVFPGNMPHKKILDEIVADRPAYMRCADGHSSWVNSRALALAGIDRRTKDPEDGRIVRDETGEPTGALLESAAHLVSRLIPEPSAEERLAAIREGLKEAARVGVVRVHGLGGEFEDLGLFERLYKEGTLTVRMTVAMWVEAPGPTDNDWKAYDDARTRCHDEWLAVDGIKLMLDGVIDSGTGAMLDPYEGQKQNRGKLFWAPKDYMKAVAAFNAKGLQVSTHSIGDAAIRLSLDAYEAGQRAAGAADVRNKIEHAEDIAAGDIARFGRLGVIGSFQPLHANPDPAWIGGWIKNAGPERERRAFAWKAVLDGGGRLAFGSDWPVVTISPWPGIQVAVTRQDLEGRPEGGWQPQHKVSLADAVYAYTMGGAYAMHREKEEGSIEAGKLADLILVSQNIFDIDPRRIADTRVLLTMVGGRIVYDAR